MHIQIVSWCYTYIHAQQVGRMYSGSAVSVHAHAEGMDGKDSQVTTSQGGSQPATSPQRTHIAKQVNVEIGSHTQEMV